MVHSRVWNSISSCSGLLSSVMCGKTSCKLQQTLHLSTARLTWHGITWRGWIVGLGWEMGSREGDMAVGSSHGEQICQWGSSSSKYSMMGFATTYSTACGWNELRMGAEALKSRLMSSCWLSKKSTWVCSWECSNHWPKWPLWWGQEIGQYYANHHRTGYWIILMLVVLMLFKFFSKRYAMKSYHKIRSYKIKRLHPWNSCKQCGS